MRQKNGEIAIPVVPNKFSKLLSDPLVRPKLKLLCASISYMGAMRIIQGAIQKLLKFTNLGKNMRSLYALSNQVHSLEVFGYDLGG